MAHLAHLAQQDLIRTCRAVLLAFAICFVIPNFLFFFTAYKLGIARPVFNLDYLFASIFFVFGQRLLAIIFLTGVFIIDTLVIQGLVYPVVMLQDILYVLSMLPYAAFIWQLAAAGLVAVLVVTILICYRYSHKAHRLSVLMLVLLSTAAYGVQNHFDESSSDFYRNKNTIFGSQAAYFINTNAIQFLDLLFQSRNYLIPIGFRGAVAKLANQDPGQLNKKVLLVVVESWGVMKDERIQDALLQPLTMRRDIFEWLDIQKTQGNATTVDAELDRLCGVKIYYYLFKPVTEGFDACLPWKFKKSGYKTIAVDGSDSHIYEHSDWYPRTGLDDLYFGNTAPWKTRCYSFPGICDSEIMHDFIAPIFAKDEKIFMYWLTLNTHTNFDERDIQTDVFDCKKFNLEEGEQLCRMNKLHAQFFSQLAGILAQPAMRGVEVILVGDHSPPILNKREYRTHVEDGLVMQVHLKVKD